MTKDYIDYIQTTDYMDTPIIGNQESSNEFYGQPNYKQYIDDWC